MKTTSVRVSSQRTTLEDYMAKAQVFPGTDKFINVAQVGGIESYILNEGEARGVRALCVNTGGGLRYRVLVDRGLDIEQAFLNQHSLTFLSYKGITPPTRALDRGYDWLKGFPVGLLTTCGPFNIGGPCQDADDFLGLHGPHSNTAATLESVIQPDAHAGRHEMSIVARVRYGKFYGPCVELKRTITSTLGRNVIRIQDELYNAGNSEVPHAWLLHINFGYPLLDEGSEFCYSAFKVEPIAGSESAAAYFRPGNSYKKVPAPLSEHSGETSYVGYIYPKADRNSIATVGVINPKLNLGVAIRYNTDQFPRCAHWQHWGEREYVAALEPCTGTVEGRDKDRARGLLGFMKPGERKSYGYEIEAMASKEEIAALKALNK